MNITNTINTHPRKFSFIVSTIICLLFFSSTPRMNVGYGDSDEFLTVGHTFGLAHPPGYSLYVATLKLASLIPIPGTTEAWRMHAVSGVVASVAIYCILILLFEMNIEYLFGKKRTNTTLKVIGITLTGVTLATAKLYWLYAQIAEKYIISAGFVALLMMLAQRLTLQPSPKVKTLIWFGIVYGLLLSHHQSMVFLLPYIVYIAWTSPVSTRLKRIAIVVSVSVAGFLAPLGVTAIQQQSSVQPSWYIEPGIKGLINNITRKDFQGTLYRSNDSTSGYLPKQITLSQITNGTGNYFRVILESTQWWLILPLLLALAMLFKKHKGPLAVYGLPSLLIGVGLGSYMNWPVDVGSQAATVRFYIPSIVTWGPLLFIGCYEMLFRLRRFMQVLKVDKRIIPVVSSLILVIPLISTIARYPQISLKNFDLTSRLYKGVLQNVKPDSIVTCYSDSSCFALMYEQTVNKARPDVDIVPLAFPLLRKTIETKQLAGFTYPNNPYLMTDIVSWNIGTRPVYAVDISQYYFGFFGFDNGFLTYIPSGYAAEISREMVTDFPQSDYRLSTEYAKKPIPSFDLMRRFLVQSVSQIHLTNGYVWLKTGDRPRAQSELSLGVNLSYQLADIEKKSSLAYRSQIERTLSSQTYAPGSKSQTSTKLLSYLPDLFKGNHNSQAFTVARGAVMANPRDVKARLELAKIFEKMGDKVFSDREYRHILMLDPQNQEAIEALSMISE